jgi:hypothetical protein
MTPEPKNVTSELLFFLAGFLVGAEIFFLIDVGTDSTIFKIFAVAGIGSLLSFFLEFTFRPGAIFGRYIDFLEKYFRDNPKNPVGFLYSPLGGCVFCMNVWLSSLLFVFTSISFDLSFLYFIPAVLISHLFLAFLDRIFWRS